MMIKSSAKLREIRGIRMRFVRECPVCHEEKELRYFSQGDICEVCIEKKRKDSGK